MTNLHSSQIRSLAEAANNITNPITEAKTSPKEHEWLSDMKGKDVAAISKLLKSKDTKALEQYLISNRLMGRDGLVQGKNLDRSAIEIIKRSFADVHEEVQVEEVETVEEATKADDEHGTAKRVDRITKFLKKYPDPSKLKAHHLDTFFNHPDYFGETDAASDAAMKKLPVQHRKQIRAMRKDYDDRNW
jgi:hypothetical protein